MRFALPAGVGNVAELENAADTIVVFSQGKPSGAMAVQKLGAGRAVAVLWPMHESGRPYTMTELEAEYIGLVMRRNDMHQGKTARDLGISDKTLYRKLQEEPLKSRFNRREARRREP